MQGLASRYERKRRRKKEENIKGRCRVASDRKKRLILFCQKVFPICRYFASKIKRNNEKERKIQRSTNESKQKETE